MSIWNAYPADLLIIIGVLFAINISSKQFYINYILIDFVSVLPPIAVAIICKVIFYQI